VRGAQPRAPTGAVRAKPVRALPAGNRAVHDDANTR
jgi:hypothetical protein